MLQKFIRQLCSNDDSKAVFVLDSFVYNSSQITTPLKAKSEVTSLLGKLLHASDQQRHVFCELGPRSGLDIAEAI